MCAPSTDASTIFNTHRNPSTSSRLPQASSSPVGSGRTYKGVQSVSANTGAAAVPIGQKPDGASVPPGDSITDVLVFRQPRQGADPLTLTLPASAVGGRGEIKLAMPKP